VVDVWFDVVTASGGALAVAIVEAVVALPPAALSLYIAWHAQWARPGGLTTARAAAGRGASCE